MRDPSEPAEGIGALRRAFETTSDSSDATLCAVDGEGRPGLASFVLVHGAVHGAWCWEPLIPYLDARPTTRGVLAVDLPGHGRRLDLQPFEEIGIDDYVAAVAEDIEAADLRDIVLVGHSLAGITIPGVAARLPDRVRRLVHLASAHPAPGESVMDLMQHPLSPVSRGIGPETMFCNDLDEERSAWLLGNIGSEPPGPMIESIGPVEVELAEPTVYILCEHDEALPPELQREQARNAGAAEIIPFDSGHSAFASRPRELAELLIGLGRG